MSKLTNALLWLTMPALLTLRSTDNRLSRRQEKRLALTDTLTRLMLVVAAVWMLAIGNWGVAALMVALLVVFTGLRMLTTAWLLSRTKQTRL